MEVKFLQTSLLCLFGDEQSRPLGFSNNSTAFITGTSRFTNLQFTES